MSAAARHKAHKHRQRLRNQDLEIERRQKVTEEQDNEIEALAAIYGGDFCVREEDETYDFVRAFEIVISPFPGQLSLNFSNIVLLVQFPREYPHTVPLLKIVSSKSLTTDELDEVLRESEAFAETMKGNPMIYEIVTLMQDFLVTRNREELSVYDSMVRNNEQEMERQLLEEQQSCELREQHKIEEDRAKAELSAVEHLSSEKELELRRQWLQQRCRGDEKRVEDEPNSPVVEAPDVEEQKLHRMQVVLAHLLRLQSPTVLPSLLEELSASDLLPTEMAKKLQNPKVLDAELDALQGLDALKLLQRDSNESSAAMPESRSRYRNDFKELRLLGSGSYGRVMKVQNRLDGRFYAVKIVQISKASEFRRILREVTTLSRLSHPYVLRYFNAWIEMTEDDETLRTLDANNEDEWLKGNSMANASNAPWDLRSDSVYRGDDLDASFSPDASILNSTPHYHLGLDVSLPMENSSPNPTSVFSSSPNTTSRAPVHHLYIQTEYCNLDLRATILREARTIDPEDIWRRFRQILEGLAHIHGQGIVHRDLKPSNIFLRPDGDVRIGDLGLAIQPLSAPQASDISEALDAKTIAVSEHTTAVGTFLYMAPEELVGASKGLPRFQYDEKVDIYSLGIILFELVYSFETAHERVNVLKRLRLPQPEFPAGFADAHPRQAKIISWLLQHDATRRPSAIVLLQSTLLPPKLEDEYMKDALRTIADPSTPFYHRLLSELFNSARPMPPESLQPSNADVQTPPPSHLESSVLLYVINSIQRMFQCHGGNFYPTRLLSRIDKDKSQLDSTLDSVLVMDREGHLLRARSDLRSPLIELAASGSAPKRCFEIGNVYRNVSSSSALRQLLQCDFDIISGERTHVADGEVLSMLAHILGKLIPSVPATIFVGHTAISDAILEFCSVPMSLRETVVRCISSFGPLASPDEIRNALESLLPCDLHPRLPALLLSFVSTPRLMSPESQLTRLHNVLIHCRPALAAIDELSRVLDVAKLFGLSPEPTSDGNNVRVVVAPLLHIGAIYSGCISRVFVDPETPKGTSSSGKCVGIAGRYEDVKRGVAGVGLSLGVKTFSELVLESETASRTISSNLAAHCTRVFVVSVGGEEMFAERLRIVGEIWALGESASMLMSETATLQEQVDEAEARHVQWLLTIKDKYYKTDGTVRLRRLDRRQDIILARDGDIAKFFSSSSRKKM